jgi:putative ABC transport system permease protein
VHRHETDVELAEEMQSYLDEAEADLIARGIPREEARRLVRLRYGDGLAAREDVTNAGWDGALSARITDLRIAARRLTRSPGFTMVAVLTLGIGVGAATAIVSVVRPVLFDPLPYPRASDIVALAERSPEGALIQSTFGTYLEVASRVEGLAAIAVSKPWQPTLTGLDEPERLEGLSVTAGYLNVLGVQPLLGSGLDPTLDRPYGPDVVVLSDRLWRGRFASDPTIVGQVIRLDARPFTVVGVMGPAFEDVTAPQADVWGLLQYEPVPVDFDSREWGHHLDMVGRLRGSVDLDEARRQLGAIAAQPLPEFARPAWASQAQGWSVRRLRDVANADARPSALILLGAAALLLVIACVNLSLLLLARDSRRRSELAMRLALGAGRGRLAGYLLTENVLLAAMGGVVGLVVAEAGVAGLVAASPPSLARIPTAGVDIGALAPAVMLTSLVLGFLGLATAFRQSGDPAPDSLRVAGRSAGSRTASARHVLVATELAVAVVLLVGAGLLVRSTEKILSVSPGFDPEGSVVFRVYGTGLERGDAATHRFFDNALDAVERLPGVSSAAFTSQLPLSGDVDMYGVTLDEPGRAEGIDGSAYRYAVTPGYFEAIGVDIQRGRGLERSDVAGGPRAVVLSEALATRLFPDQDPVGGRLQFGAAVDRPFTVVGVATDVKQASLASDQVDAVYVAAAQWHWADRVRWLVVRSDRAPADLVPAVRRAIWSVDRNQPIVQVQSTADLVARSEALRRFVLIVLGAFAVSAMGLAGIGLYGVLSGGVTERSREIGLRGALGASRTDIVALVVRRAMTVAAFGLFIGLGIATFASRTLASLLFDVSPIDPTTYVAVVLLLTLVAGASCWVPATRAARLDPVVTLRAD